MPVNRSSLIKKYYDSWIIKYSFTFFVTKKNTKDQNLSIDVEKETNWICNINFTVIKYVLLYILNIKIEHIQFKVRLRHYLSIFETVNFINQLYCKCAVYVTYEFIFWIVMTYDVIRVSYFMVSYARSYCVILLNKNFILRTNRGRRGTEPQACDWKRDGWV